MQAGCRPASTMSRMRRLVLVSLLALALPTLVHAATSPVVAAAKRTASAKSVTFQMSARVAVPGQGAVSMTGTGVQRGTDAKLSMRMRGQGVALRFDALLLQERRSYVMYMRSPAFRGQLPPGKSWVRVDLSKQATGVGLDVTSLLSASQSYAPFEKALVSTTRVGREVVAGRPATHYRAVVDLRRAASALPEYAKQLAVIERQTGVRLGRVPYHVWVGTDGRLRRVRFSMPTGTRTARGTSVLTMTFVAFDRPVTVAAPPRAQVVSP